MLIHDIRGNSLLLQVCIGNQADVGISGSYGIKEFPIPHFIIRSEVFISDFDIIHPERLRMSHLGPQASPYRVFAAHSIFYGIQCILQHILQFFSFKQHRRSSLAGHAAVAHIQGFHVKILAKLQIFMKSQAVIAAVMPHQLMAGTFPYRPYYISEPHGCFRGKAFHNTAAREPQEPWIQSLQFFHQILSQSMPHIRVLRHQGTEAKAYFTALRAADGESGIIAVPVCRKAAVIAHIPCTLQQEIHTAEHMGIILSADSYADRMFCFRKHIKRIGFSGFQGNPVKACII